jgi:hypothetical protein
LHALYQSSTLVGDEERSFESLVEPLRAILVPVATSVSNPYFQQVAQEFDYIKAYLISSQNTMSRHGGAAIADHGSLGSQQNPGPVMVCNPVFNHFSPSLPRHDNYAIIVAIRSSLCQVRLERSSSRRSCRWQARCPSNRFSSQYKCNAIIAVRVGAFVSQSDVFRGT